MVFAAAPGASAKRATAAMPRINLLLFNCSSVRFRLMQRPCSNAVVATHGPTPRGRCERRTLQLASVNVGNKDCKSENQHVASVRVVPGAPSASVAGAICSSCVVSAQSRRRLLKDRLDPFDRASFARVREPSNRRSSLRKGRMRDGAAAARRRNGDVTDRGLDGHTGFPVGGPCCSLRTRPAER